MVSEGQNSEFKGPQVKSAHGIYLAVHLWWSDEDYGMLEGQQKQQLPEDSVEDELRLAFLF